ncbi:GIDE domain-containing protein [Celerinatantimonas sp. MCCC 1A17872]|uniref:GIDE domain-containing protein n=1 Tax=Celerinatantimonas sp. MCCC 1A17872 TaxID=3177514 RepID=UPI0038C61CD8
MDSMTSGQWTAILVMGGIFLICFAAFIGIIRRNYHRYRMVADTATSKIRSAPQGYVELIGKAIACSGETYQRAPFSDLACLWFLVEKERKVVTKDKDGKETVEWRTEFSRSSDTPFLLEDDTGCCKVEPYGADVTPAIFRRVSSTYDSISSSEILAGRSVGYDHRYRYSESLIVADDPLYALGEFKTFADKRSGEQYHSMVKPEYREQPFVISSKGETKLLKSYLKRIWLNCFGLLLFAALFAMVIFIATHPGP